MQIIPLNMPRAFKVLSENAGSFPYAALYSAYEIYIQLKDVCIGDRDGA